MNLNYGILGKCAERTISLSKTIEESMIIALSAVRSMSNMRICSIDREKYIINARSCPSSLFSDFTQEITVALEKDNQGIVQINIYSKNSVKKQWIDYGANANNASRLASAITSNSNSSYNNPTETLQNLIQKCKDEESFQDKESYKRIALFSLACFSPLAIGYLIRQTCEVQKEEQYTYWLFGDHVGTKMVNTPLGNLSVFLLIVGFIMIPFWLFFLNNVLAMKAGKRRRRKKTFFK